MKKINLISRLLSYSHEKQSPQRFFRYAVMLIMLLTLGVGQMWAGASWIGKSFIVFNGTWYNGSGSGQAAGAFNGKTLGKISSLTLGGEVQTYGQSSGSSNPARMYYKFDSGSSSYITLYWFKYADNNNYFHSNSNGSTSSGNAFASKSIDISGLSAGDHTLAIWFYQPDGDQYDSNSSSNYVATITVNPLVTFKANGGTGSDYTQRVTYNTNTALSSNTFTKTGYDFAGWATSADGNVVYADGGNVKLTAHTNLFAKWTPKETTVTLSANAPGGQTVTGGGTEVTATYDAALPSFSALTCTGDYALTGYWTTASGAGTKVINANGSFAANDGIWNRTDGATLTLHARWSLDRTLTYDGNTSTGGSVPASPAVYSNGASVTVLGNTNSLVKTGYTFAGWNTAANGSGASYSAGDNITMNANYTLYAQWTENLTTVNLATNLSGAGTFTIGGETVTSTTAGVTTTRSVTAVPYPGFRTNSTLWSKNNNYITLSSTSTNPTTVTGDGSNGNTTTLTGNFTQTYAYLQGRMSIYSAIARSSETHIASSKGGWDKSSNRIKMTYDGTNHRFYLHTYKTPKELTDQQNSEYQWFSFKTSTNSSTLANAIAFEPASNQIMTTTGSANKKTVSAASTDYHVRFNSSVTDGYAIIYFDESGVWYEVEHALIYNNNGGSGSVTATACYMHGTNATAAGVGSMSKSQYTFGGWNTTQYITGTSYAASASVPMNTNTTLYAKWNRDITLNPNGGSSGSSSVTATYNCATLPSITAPSKSGYTLSGWNTNSDGISGSDVINGSGALQASVSGWTDASGRFTRTTSGATLYAKWSQDITLNYNASYHGAGSNKTATVLLNATALSSITHCTPATGYQLEGYYTAASGGTKILNANGNFAGNNITVDAVAYTSSGKWVKAGATTLYAHYTAKTYDVILNVNGATTGSNQTVTATYDAAMPTTTKTSGALVAPSKTGYTFGGYWTTNTGTGTQYYTSGLASNHVWDVDANNTNIYAKWTENNYTVSVVSSDATYGGTVASSSVNGHYVTKVTLPTATAKLGYYFTGWEITSGSATLTNASSASSAQIHGMTDAVTVRANFASIWALVGTMNSWNANTNRLGNYSTVSTKDYGYVDVDLAANTRYSFKMKNVQTSAFYKPTSSNTEITYANKATAQGMNNTVDGDPNQTIMTAGAGTYRFTWNATDHSIKVTYPDSYTVTFGSDGHASSVTASVESSGAITSGQYAASGKDITFSQTANTGYELKGWYTTAGGNTAVTGMSSSDNVLDDISANATVYAQYNAKTYTVTLDLQTDTAGYDTGGDDDLMATYDAPFPSFTKPTAANGWAFMGYWSKACGKGTQFTDANGALLADITDYSDGSGNWKYDASDLTLYAYYEKAAITALTFDAGTVEPEATVGVTPTISPTPTGTTTICWTILYSNDTPLDPQPSMTYSEGKLTFAASSYSGTYKVQAVLKTGNDCSGGTTLDTETASFVVAGSHTVTVNYKCGDDVIKASTSVTGRPTTWSDDITAPDVFGYTFSSWSSADGVTIKDSENEDVTSSTESTIKIKAAYAGSLTANYTQNQMIFFKNTLEWSNVYVNFYTDSYWNNPKGSGNQSVTKRNLAMTQYGETDIWYYDYGAASITPSLYVSFTSESQDNTEFFWKAGGVNVVYPANYQDDIHTNKSSETGFKAATPMFVPLATQEKVTLNQSSGGKADYYNDGYWTTFTPGTGYRLEIYNSDGSSMLKYADFESADDLMPMKAVVNLEGGQTYKFQIRRGGESSAGVYYGNSGTMTYTNHGQDTPWAMTNSSFTMAGITSNAPGDYTFNLSYSPNSTNQYRLRVAVDYPVKSGDYRLVYSDAVQTKPLTSAIVNKVDDGSDIVSFFVRPGSTPVLRIQQASIDGSTVTWNEYPTSGTPTNQIKGDIATALTSGGTDVYNFNLSMNGSGALSVASVEKYDGNYYIRTDAANSKWDNYRTDPDHLMTYSEYSITHGGYTHYYTHWVDKDVKGRKNVKFVIANDYSPNISDTLARETASGIWTNISDFMEAGGDLKRSANVRFMWDKRDNSISRAYVDGAQTEGTQFLTILSADSKVLNPSTEAVQATTTFSDKGNWMYEANVKAEPGAAIKLKSSWGKAGETDHIIDQYFKGAADATEELIGGSGSNPYDIRIIYDFKTNRMIAGLIPSGTIDEEMAIHADVMFIREHHGDIAQLTFAEKDSKMGAITNIETAFGVLQFSKWTINNKSKETGHAPLSPLLSRYERDLFYVSFPFKVAMEDVFGFGTYGQHWIIEEYDGATRATNGYWLESAPNWKFVTNRKNKFFEPGQGYIIALDLDEMGESADIWANTDRVELYFPSYGTMDNITSSTATYNIPAHLCTIDRSGESNGQGGTLGSAYDRRVKDSHWNVLGVPTYVNPLAPNYANTAWTTEAGETSIGPNFLYQWTMTDNTVTPVSASGYTYHAMHAYLVQYCGDVTWTSSVSVAPSSIVARRMSVERPQNVEFRLEMMQNDVAVDQTYVKLSDDEHVTTGFEFNYDLSKEFNSGKSSIYTLIGAEQVAGNVLPLIEQTTVVPVGVKIAANGDYTFSMPDGTEGIGVTLIDNETGIRTSLSALDYTINLSAGTYENRFVLEISPIKQTPTGVELINGENGENGVNGVRKVMIDGILYIVKDGKMFDARGTMVK